MRFEWDERKNRSNLQKHKVSFDVAAMVFDDPHAVSLLDRVEGGEERWQTLGSAGGGYCYWWRIRFVKATAKSAFGSSRRARLLLERGNSMKKVSKKQAKELTAIARMPDDRIDLTDSPEVRDWRNAVVGKFYRPIKTPVTIRVDADVLDWLKRQGRGYQTRINQLLREAMEAKARRRA